ncbi:MAG TPA: two-component sensor histidine kinase [Rikenellaceae bacterium]|nr:two-component sensor histidine kinase [Rikenellaceae bacterium]
MRLIHNIAVRLAMALLPVIALWAMIFYFVMVDEINDEADDLLESYAESLMSKKLSGNEFPVANLMTDKHYSVRNVTRSYAASHSWMEFYDSDFWIAETDESEPARFLRTIFRDHDGQFFELTVSTPTFEKEDLKETILWWILTLYAILLLTVLFITLAVLQKSMDPFYRILDWLGNYTPGHSHEKLDVNSNVSEFTQLERAATGMANRSDEVFEKQKQFIGNASHELQTPLAILGGRIDWMLDNESLNEETMGELIQMKREIGHIVRLNKTLLLLTKIDNGQFPEMGEVDLKALTEGQMNIFKEIFSGKNVDSRLEVPEDPVVINMNETLAAILVSNLIKNAFTHSTEGDQVTVSLTRSELTVRNSGLSALDVAHIFDRFYQGTRKDGSTGLGLAIAKTIADRNGMRLEYSFIDGMHRFRLEFR